jgi:hypothetical protein
VKPKSRRLLKHLMTKRGAYLDQASHARSATAAIASGIEDY